MVEPRLERQLTADVDETHQLMRRFLLNLRRKQKSRGGREVAEAHIC
jgi:hypothetical protein